ncbi:FAD/NAD-P-binding domain-containing protein [Moniliophthora roreri]|nr:FAD/NAD-P-binding domain-containing protein [Moniliophthora roreri]
MESAVDCKEPGFVIRWHFAKHTGKGTARIVTRRLLEYGAILRGYSNLQIYRQSVSDIMLIPYSVSVAWNMVSWCFGPRDTYTDIDNSDLSPSWFGTYLTLDETLTAGNPKTERSLPIHMNISPWFTAFT